MSQGLAQYEQTVAGFGNATDSIRSFTATYDTDFFRDWTEKHNLAMEKLKSAADVSGGIGGAYIAGKLAYGAVLGRRQKKADDDEDDEDETEETNTDDHDGDEDGRNDHEDGEEGEGAEEEFEGFGDDAADAAVTAPDIAAPLAGDAVTAPALSTAAPASVGEDAAQQFAASDGDLASQMLQPIGGTATSPRLQAPAGEDTGGAGGEAGGAAGGEAGGDIAATFGETALEVGAVAAEAIPVLGIFASIGIGLYELFHHPKKAPSAPPPSTANSKGEMVLPSYDSVVDTPASQSAF